MDEIVLSNTSISFFSINAVSGTSIIKKEIIFENITIRDSYYEARNPLINLGPFYTDQDVHLGLTNLTFYGLVFEDTSNVIHINWQSPTPITIEGWTFNQNEGGYILLEPVSTSDGSHLVEVIL